MIQRIQSIYFLLAGLLPAFLFWLPTVSLFPKDGNGEASFMLTGFGLVQSSNQTLHTPAYGVLLFTILAIVLPLAAIFCFKNRKRQIRLANLHLISVLMLCLSVLAYGYSFAGGTGNTMAFQWGICFPLLSYAMGFLARRAVRKDEELIRSTERFR